MNEVLNTLQSRRSIRKYKTDQISQTELDAILQAGTYAASGNGKQSALLVAVQNPELVAHLSSMNAKIMGVTSDPFYGAPTVVIVLADPEWVTYVEDGCLVLGNLMNAAASLGIGSCWIHRAKEEFESPDGKELLKQWGIPERYVGIGHCILGYPDETPKAAPRKQGYIKKVL